MKENTTGMNGVPEWKGYTLEELQYQKALVLVRLEMQKERLSGLKESLVNGSKTNVVSRLWGQYSANKNVIQYAIVGFKMFQTVRKILKRFRRK